MKQARWPTLLLVTTLSSVPLSADPPRASKDQAPGPTGEATPYITRLAGEAGALFFELSPFAGAGPTVAQFAIEIRGQLLMTETVTVERSPDLGAWGQKEGIELLSGNPSQLAELERRAAAGDDVRVHVTVEGRSIGEYSWSELAARSTELVEGGFRPLDLRAELRRATGTQGTALRNLFGATITPAGCAHNCDTAYITCQDNCDSRPIPNCDSTCDTRHMQCLVTCGCPITLDTSTTTTVLGYSDTGQRSCFQISAGVTLFYEKLNILEKVTQTTDTEQCDGTIVRSSTVTYPTTCCCYRALSSGGCVSTNPAPCVTS